MSKNDSPAGTTGGPVTLPALDDLPEKMRVHALAKLLGLTSREVLAALADLGVEARSAQSSIDRKAAEQVITALAPQAAPAPAPDAPADPPPAATAPLVPVFAPPAPLFQPPTRPVRSRGPVADDEDEPAAVDDPPARPARTRRRAAGDQDEPPAVDGPPARAARTRRRAVAEDREEPAAEDEPVMAVEPAADDPIVDDTDDVTEVDDADDDGTTRRRRRRGRRGRGRGRGGDEGTDETDDIDDESDDDAAESAGEAEDESDDQTEDENEEPTGTGRRRRRRRRRGAGEDATDAEPDPPGTVTRVRQPREQRSDDGGDGDGVQSVRGSTRLEAKRQRRRDGRDAGRRRVPILSEAEFLARRESVDRSMVVRERGDRIEIAVLEDEILVEHFIASVGGADKSMAGNIYLGRVQNVLPSMEAAFVDIGRGRNAVLYAGEVDWDAAGLGGKARRIEQALSSGDSVLVQVTKDPIGHKGARLTTQISLAGRFLVYVPSGGAAGISRKLPDVERRRLKDMLKEIVPSEAGVIIRTASEGVSHEALERDVRRLQAQWDVVKARSEQTGPSKPKAPVLLYEEPDLLIKVVRDQFNEDFSRLVVQGDDAWDTLANYVGHVAPELADRLHRHVGTRDAFAEYRIDEQLLKALDRKVWLPSGGTLVIDRTEAMTVIDVNTGKFTGFGGNLEETVTRNNLEAAEEVVRQLRLRDVGGIIVIDFIDMVLEANRDLVLRRLTECLARDRTRHQVAEVTSLGLVQMTRKRVGGGLLEHFSTPCEHCRGRGVVVTADPVLDTGDAGRTAERDGGGLSDRGRRSRGGRGRRGDGSDGAGQESNGSGGGARSEATADASGPAGLAPAAGVALSAGLAEVASASARVGVPGAAMPEPAAGAVEPGEVGRVEGAPIAASAVEVGVVPVGSEAAEPTPDGPPAPDTAEPGAVGVAAAAPSMAEEVAVELSVAEEATAGLPDAEPGSNGHPRPRQRRGRVTRTAGAPASAGDAPVIAVVTVPAAVETTPVTVPAAVAPQPEPTAPTRPRRTRRAASRPAGPPVADGADAPATDASTDGGDPV